LTLFDMLRRINAGRPEGLRYGCLGYGCLGRSAGQRYVALACLAFTVSLVAAAPAEAQIYSWRDANGNLVVSNRRPAASAQVHAYAVPRAEGVKATRYAPMERVRIYDDLISEHARTNGVRTDLVRAVVQVESAFNPSARSPKGALGLMQLMPATIRQFGVRNPFNPVENVRAGVAYLRELLDRYQNSEELALAAYNAGPGAVDKHGQNVPPYRETRNYVAHINQMAGRPIERRSSTIYKVNETIDGRPVVRYTDRKPSTGMYEVAGR
jgi:soluble lytic murein transglycosylase-like protein